jgi:hypothetical protein
MQPCIPCTLSEPDLIVEAVELNPDCQHYYFANESNVVDVTVKNIGAGAAGASHVKLSGTSALPTLLRDPQANR